MVALASVDVMPEKLPKRPFERSPHVPEELWNAENDLIHLRRHGTSAPQGEAKNEHVVGLALSGGGIRSATLSLGILQGLAKHDCLSKVDYLSTVSGGGYAGAFLGGLYERWERPEGKKEERADAFARVKKALGNSQGHPIDWLRENGRYLAPNGAGSLALAAAIAIRNLVAIHLVIGSFFLMLSLAIIGLRRSVTRFAEPVSATPRPAFFQRYFEESNAFLTSHDVWISPIVFAAVLVMIVFAVPCGIAYWLVRSDERRNGDSESDSWRLAAGALVLVAGVLGCWFTLQSFHAHVLGNPKTSVLPVLLTGSLSLSMLSALIMAAPFGSATGIAMRTHLTTRLRDSLIASAALLGLAFIDTIGQTLYVRVLDGNVSLVATWISGAFTAAATLATFAQRLAGVVSDKTKGTVTLSVNLIATIAGFSLLFLILVGFSAISHSLSWDDGWLNARVDVSTQSDAVYELAGSDGSKTIVSPAAGQARLCRGAGQLQKCTPSALDPWKYWLALAGTTLLTLFFGRTRTFVNRSSLATFYGTRLTRAYLGASNPKRLDEKNKMLDVLLPDDELALSDYRPHLHGGPLPLINVTLNETTGGRSQVDQRDRKGMIMTIGPAGISVGVKHHAAWTSKTDDVPRAGGLKPTSDPSAPAFRVFPGPDQTLSPYWPTLGRWIAISGAAISTGLGARTSTGLALVLGLLNFRLGHWWNSEIDPAKRSTPGSQRAPLLSRALRALLPVHAMLLHELFARFPGTSSRDWYLSDGGHFENSGAYELIRRRLPYIIVCDNGADPKRCFDDLGNLVRKVRNDFGAHIEFVGADKLRALELDRAVGTLGQLGFCGRLSDAHAIGASEAADLPIPSNSNAAGSDVTRYATLARIRYDDDDDDDDAPGQISALLVLRPAVLGREPLDVLNYQVAHPTFPQQGTGDQFFEEEQWEAYRRLGENMASEVFAALRPAADSGDWPMIDLERLRDDVSLPVLPAAQRAALGYTAAKRVKRWRALAARRRSALR
jgi:hypothetical protein